MSPLDLPVSVVLALWAQVPSSRGPQLVQGPDGVHEVIDERLSPGLPLSLTQWLDLARPLERSLAVLPAPADPLAGLGAALETGHGVLIETARSERSLTPGRRVLLVPQDSGTSVVWQAHEVTHAVPPLDPSQARRDVHTATQEAIETLTDLDLARERPDLADDLTDLVTAVMDPRLVPPWMDQRRRGLLEQSLRLAGICELALQDDGAAVTLAQAQRRRDVLQPLTGVARQGVSAATELWAGTAR